MRGSRAAVPAHPGPEAARATAWGITALGMEVWSPLPLLGASRRAVAPKVRGAEVRVADSSGCTMPAGAAAEVVLERRHLDGSVGMRVCRRSEGSYLIEAPGYAEFEIAPDGDLITCDGLQGSRVHWHRPLYAQALPLAAALRGLEVLHASAAVIDGRALAFVAPSGTGKTTLAIALVSRGAELLADDVVAVECVDGTVLAHPGVPTANVALKQLQALPPAARIRLGDPIATGDKVQLALRSPRPRPAPLAAVVFLKRAAGIEQPALERRCPPDPIDLLAATFMPHVASAARLRAQLDLCARVASTVPVFSLRAPLALPPHELAAIAASAAVPDTLVNGR
ncbi:MAG: hypothetical protein ACRDL5_04495 [Solirubrobacteraceae bacterium]